MKSGNNVFKIDEIKTMVESKKKVSGYLEEKYFGNNIYQMLGIKASISYKELEGICRKVNYEDGPNYMVTIDENSPIQRDSLFVKSRLGEYSTNKYNPLSLPPHSIYLFNYLDPRIMNLVLSGQLLLSTEFRDLQINYDVDSINVKSGNVDEFKELHEILYGFNKEMGVKQLENIINFWQNMMIASTVLYKRNSRLLEIFEAILYNIEMFEKSRADKTFTSTLSNIITVSRGIEQICPGLGTSLFNWLTSLVKVGSKTNLFSEYIKLKRGKEWYIHTRNDQITLTSLDLSSTDALYIVTNPSNPEAAKALYEWIKINQKLVQNSQFDQKIGMGEGKKISPNIARAESLLYPFLSNLFGAISPYSTSLEFSRSFIDNILRRIEKLPISFVILADQGTSHFEKLFKIWYLGNQKAVKGNLEGLKNLWGIGINHDGSITSFDDILQHWMKWYLKDSMTCSDYENIQQNDLLGDNKHYLSPYTITTEYNSADLHFLSAGHYLISPFDSKSNLKKKYPFPLIFVRKKIVKEVAYSKAEFLNTKIILNGKDIGADDTAIGFCKLPRTFTKLSQSQKKFLNFRDRNHAYDRIRQFQRLSRIKEIFNDDLFTHTNVFDGSREIGYMTDTAWDNVIEQYANEIINFNGKSYTIRELDQYLKNNIKPIFYDWFIAIKYTDGKISSLLSIEYLGCDDEGYLKKKDWDAAQLKGDNMPMIYVVANPKIKNSYLKSCSVIGKDFPILTQTEFSYFIKGLHVAYTKMGEQFSLENYIKRVMIIEKNQTIQNYEHWNIPKFYAEMIQGSFGINNAGEFYGKNTDFNWIRNGYMYKGEAKGPWYIPYTWGNNLKNSFWLFSQESIVDNNKKIFIQFETWLNGTGVLNVDGGSYSIAY